MADPAADGAARATADTALAASAGAATPPDAAPAAVAAAAATNAIGADPFGGELFFSVDTDGFGSALGGSGGDGGGADAAAAAGGDAASFFAVEEDDGICLDLALKPTSAADEAVTSIAATYKGHRQRRADAERRRAKAEGREGGEDGDGGPGTVIYAVGTKVDCRFGGLDDYYRGVVEAVNDGGRSYDILYDDGDREHGASRRRLGNGAGVHA